MTAAAARPSPLVSVALCVYNGERHLREQLDSVLAQENVALEVVAVDDGSSDGSVALLREYAARDRRVRVYVNPGNLGPLRSFERAMSLGRGEFIAPCDQDDRWLPHKLSRLLAVIGEADLAYCDSEYIDASGGRLGRRVSDDLIMLDGTDPLRFVFHNSVSGHAMLLRSRVLAVAGAAPERLYHDWWLAMCAAAHGGIVYLDQALVQFRRHADAYSPVGNNSTGAAIGSAQRKRQGYLGTANRKWIDERTYLAAAMAATHWPGQAAARDWARALRSALEQPLPLYRAIWRYRRSLPPWRGLPAFNALRFCRDCRRKLRRARREPPTLQASLFRN